MPILASPFIVPLGAFAAGVFIVYFSLAQKSRAKELDYELRLREMEHEKKLKEMELEMARLKSGKPEEPQS